MAHTNYWKHRNIDLLRYGTQGAAGPSNMAEERKQASILSDWNRYAKKGNPDECPYFINGTNLSTLKNDGFVNMAELHAFVKTHLFSKIPNASDELVTHALSHFNQGGIPTATYFSISSELAASRSKKMLPEPNYQINFEATKNGVKITEKDTYKEWKDCSSRGKPITHRCSEKKPYYAQTTTTSLFTPEQEIKILDLQVDCPSRNLTAIFDKRTYGSRIADMFAKIMNRSAKESTPEEPKTIFKP